jgi:hypothetical protein
MPILKLDGDARGAVKATSDVAKGVKEIRDETDKSAKSADEWTRKVTDGLKQQRREKEENRRLDRQLGDEAKRLLLENETAQERYNRKIADLSRLFVAGKINLEQMDRALARYNLDLNQVVPAQQQAFGPSALASARAYFTGLFGPTALVASAVAILREYRNEVDAVSQGMQANIGGLGQLMTLAAVEATPEAQQKKKDALIAESYKIARMGAAPDLNRAGELVYQLEQAGLNPEQRMQLARAKAIGVLPEAQNTATSIAALRTAYPNLKPDQASGMGIYAGIVSPGSVDTLVQDAAKSAQQLKTLGWNPEVGLAATSFLTKAYPGKGQGGTRLEQFTKQLERFGYQHDPGLRNLDPIATLKRIGAATQGGEDRPALEKYVGNRDEAIQGFRSLYQNRDQLQQLIKGTALADGGFLKRAIELAENTREIDTARQANASRTGRAIGLTGSAETRQLFQAAVDDEVRWRREQGASELITGYGRLKTWLMQMIESDSQLEERLRIGVRDNQIRDPELLETIRRHLASIDAKTKAAPAGTGRQEQ